MLIVDLPPQMNYEYHQGSKAPKALVDQREHFRINFERLLVVYSFGRHDSYIQDTVEHSWSIALDSLYILARD